MTIKLKRVYEKPNKSDGFRILVDRLWPRGISKEEAKVDLWLKDIAPSDKLRKWFGHKPERWKEFKKKYLNELRDKETAIKQIKSKKNVTLVYAAKEKDFNNAIALRDYLGDKK